MRHAVLRSGQYAAERYTPSSYKMVNSDIRCLPFVAVDLDQIRVLLSPVLKGAAIIGVKRVKDGLKNTIYRVTLADRGGSLCLRIFAAGKPRWEKERKILTHVSGSLPVPDLLLAD